MIINKLLDGSCAVEDPRSSLHTVAARCGEVACMSLTHHVYASVSIILPFSSVMNWWNSIKQAYLQLNVDSLSRVDIELGRLEPDTSTMIPTDAERTLDKARERARKRAQQMYEEAHVPNRHLARACDITEQTFSNWRRNDVKQSIAADAFRKTLVQVLLQLYRDIDRFGDSAPESDGEYDDDEDSSEGEYDYDEDSMKDESDEGQESDPVSGIFVKLRIRTRDSDPTSSDSCCHSVSKQSQQQSPDVDSEHQLQGDLSALDSEPVSPPSHVPEPPEQPAPAPDSVESPPAVQLADPQASPPRASQPPGAGPGPSQPPTQSPSVQSLTHRSPAPSPVSDPTPGVSVQACNEQAITAIASAPPAKPFKDPSSATAGSTGNAASIGRVPQGESIRSMHPPSLQHSSAETTPLQQQQHRPSRPQSPQSSVPDALRDQMGHEVAAPHQVPRVNPKAGRRADLRARGQNVRRQISATVSCLPTPRTSLNQALRPQSPFRSPGIHGTLYKFMPRAVAMYPMSNTSIFQAVFAAIALITLLIATEDIPVPVKYTIYAINLQFLLVLLSTQYFCTSLSRRLWNRMRERCPSFPLLEKFQNDPLVITCHFTCRAGRYKRFEEDKQEQDDVSKARLAILMMKRILRTIEQVCCKKKDRTSVQELINQESHESKSLYIPPLRLIGFFIVHFVLYTVVPFGLMVMYYHIGTRKDQKGRFIGACPVDIFVMLQQLAAVLLVTCVLYWFQSRSARVCAAAIDSLDPAYFLMLMQSYTEQGGKEAKGDSAQQHLHAPRRKSIDKVWSKNAGVQASNLSNDEVCRPIRFDCYRLCTELRERVELLYGGEMAKPGHEPDRSWIPKGNDALEDGAINQ